MPDNLPNPEFKELTMLLRSFYAEREWEQFHNPKNLVMALNKESSELLEIFQWLDMEASAAIVDNPELMAKVEDEAADAFNYLLTIADKLNFSLIAAAKAKIAKNAAKYPVEKSRGRSTKYTELR
jgi:NTP pyrophosphatase (non-canonical NTP hydrolase)